MNAQSRPLLDLRVLVQLLSVLDPRGRHHLTAISGEGEIVSRLFANAADEEITAWVTQFAEWGLYYSANEPAAGAPNRKLSKAHIARLRMAWVEIDIVLPVEARDWTLPEKQAWVAGQREILIARAAVIAGTGPCPPTIVLDSGNGVHLLWLFAQTLDATAENGRHARDLEDLNRGLAAAFGGDAVHNVDRILRLPGTVNRPDARKRAQGKVGGPTRVLHVNDRRYAPEEIARHYPPVAAADLHESEPAIAAALEALDFDTAAEGPAPDLMARLHAASRQAPRLAHLLEGTLSPPPGDGTASGWRFALAGEMARAGFTIDDFAQAAFACAHCLPSSGVFTPRMLARDWARATATDEQRLERDRSLLAPVEGEVDVSAFPTIDTSPPAPVEIDWINPADWYGIEPKEREWFIPGILPHNEVTMLTGKGGVGKSLLALMKLVCIAMGLPFFGRPTRRAKVVAFLCEDDADELHRRVRDICAYLGVDMRDLGEWMRLADRKYADNLLATFRRGDGAAGVELVRTPAFEALLRFAREFGAEVALLDTIADVFGGDEINRQQVRQFVQGCAGRLAQELGACMILGHPSKSGQAEGGDGTSGSTAWHGSVRSRLYLDEAGEAGSGYRKLTLMKSNYGPSGETWTLRYARGVLEVVSASRPAEGVPETASLVHGVVLAAVARAQAAGVRMLYAVNSPNNIVKVLRRRDADALKAYSPKQVEEAVAQLTALGHLSEEVIGRNSGRNPVKSITVRALPDEMSDTILPDEPLSGGLFD
jgi:hypothetical protein